MISLFTRHSTNIIFIFCLIAKYGISQSKYYTNHELDTNYFRNDAFVVKIKPSFRHSFSSRNNLKKEVSNDLFASIKSCSSVLDPVLYRECEKRNKLRSTSIQGNDVTLYFTIEIDKNVNRQEFISKLEKSGMVDLIEPARKFEPLVAIVIPNDKSVRDDQGKNFKNWQAIKAFEAWGVEQGDTNVVIAISDLSVDVNHVDLKDNIKVNWNDPIDDVDNDNDGYVDNHIGWDFGQNDNNVVRDVNESQPHGTYVSGNSSATPNNDTLLAGSGYNCKFVPLKISNNGAIIQNSAYNSIVYAGLKGYKVINLSWGGGGQPSAVDQSFMDAAVLDYDLVVVAAAGNTGTEIDFYPASYNNVVSVAGCEEGCTRKWGFSSFSYYVDIIAPADVEILNNQGVTQMGWGTSFSAPIVAGAAGLVRSKFPELKAYQVAELLRMSGDVIDTTPEFRPFKFKLGRKLNMYRALTEMPTSVRIVNPILANNDNGTAILPGDTAYLRFDVVSYLTDVQQLKIKLRANNIHITLLDSLLEIQQINKLDTARIRQKQVRFVVADTAPVDLTLEVFAFLESAPNNYEDFQFMRFRNVITDFLDLNANNIVFSVINNARLGFNNLSGTTGNGYRRNNTNLVFEGGLMLASNKGNLSDCIRTNSFSPQKADFKQTGSLRYVPVPYAPMQIENRYVDTGRFKLGVEVKQRTFAFNQSQDDNYVILEYVVTNNTDSVYEKLHAGIFFDWDLPAIGVNDNFYYQKNRSFWDANNRMGVAFNTLSTGMYSAIKILTPGTPYFRSIDVATLGPTFSEGLKYTFMNAGVSNPQAGYSQSLGTDIAQMIGVTFDDVKPGEKRTVALALISGTDLASVQNTSTIAQNRYRSVRTSPTPQIPLLNACLNQDVDLIPSNGSLFSFYRDYPTGQDPDVKSNKITFSNLANDTILFVTGADSIFESNPVLARVRVNEFIGDFSYGSLPFSGKYYFSSSTKNVTNWDWTFDTLGTDFGNTVEFEFPLNGVYSVSLRLVNNIGCVDTVTKKITVSNVITTLLEGVMGDLRIFPNPAKDYIIVDIPDQSNGNYFTIDNIIGVRVHEQANLTHGENKIELNNYPNGIYFLNVFIQGKLTKIKFLIAR